MYGARCYGRITAAGDWGDCVAIGPETGGAGAPALPVCNALWLGGKLGPLETACLASFVRHGHRVVLHVYDDVGGIPAGVETADAAAILPRSRIIRYKHSGGSLALFSDLFRYEILRRGKGIWIDCDMYCVRPVAGDSAHVYGWESDTSINCAILGLPPGLPLLDRLADIFENPSPSWPWIGLKDRLALEARANAGETLTVGDLPWGATGPAALTYYLRDAGLAGHAAPRPVYYPLSWEQAPLLARTGYDVARVITPQTRTIHLWHSSLEYRVPRIERGSALDRLYTTGLLVDERRLPAVAPRTPAPMPAPAVTNSAARSILVATAWNPEPWRAAVKALDASRPVVVWPNVGNRAEVGYAMVWNPPAAAFAGMNNLRAIFCLGAGVDWMIGRYDLPDVPIARIVDPRLTNRMTEWVTLQVLMHHRRQRWYDGQQTAHRWGSQHQPAAGEVSVGIMGLGELGRSAAEVLVRLGFNVAGWSRTRREVAGVRSFAGAGELSEFLERTEILVALLPLTYETRGVLSMPLFQRLSRKGKLGPPVLINAGRGGLQVEADIVAALDAGILGGASLDVFQREPLNPASPLWDRPNVIITPHIAASSYPEDLAPGILRQIAAFERGEALRNVVDRTRGY